MYCPYCKHEDTKVVDSRLTADNTSVRRRRACLLCGRRFTTYERYEKLPVVVVKRDGRSDPFERQKLVDGVLKACKKRPVSYEQIEKLATDVEQRIQDNGFLEIPARMVGEYVLDVLAGLDKVAYMRYASVLKDFEDLDSFSDEIKKLERLKSDQ
ncbi:MAG: transcriptional regulator NrdR [bacterium]|nr:transcriptional regulator NrdR [bacterium]